jgi:hypothetical protein
MTTSNDIVQFVQYLLSIDNTKNGNQHTRNAPITSEIVFVALSSFSKYFLFVFAPVALGRQLRRMRFAWNFAALKIFAYANRIVPSGSRNENPVTSRE